MEIPLSSRHLSSNTWRNKTAAVVLLAAVPALAHDGVGLSLGHVLVSRLESRFVAPELSPDEQIDGIIALGGALDRMEAAAVLARQYPNARLIITGKGEEASHQRVIAIGAAPEQLVLETKADNTYENAVYTRQLVNPKPGERFLLVTSAAHMPRAVGCFRKVGFDVVPWPVTPNAAPKYRYAMNIAQHEWIGLLAYRLRGRTDAFLPGPETRTR